MMDHRVKPGDDDCVAEASRVISVSDSIFKQRALGACPIRAKKHTDAFPRADGAGWALDPPESARGLPRSRPHQMRGDGAPPGATSLSSLDRSPLAKAANKRAHRLAALHQRCVPASLPEGSESPRAATREHMPRPCGTSSLRRLLASGPFFRVREASARHRSSGRISPPFSLARPATEGRAP